MIVTDIPEKVFLLGQKNANGTFSFTFHKDKQNLRVLCCWSSASLVQDWLTSFCRSNVFSELPRDLLFQVLISKPVCDLVVYNPSSATGDLGQESFDASTLPIDQVVRLNKVADILPLIRAQLIKNGFDSTKMKVLYNICQRHPDLSPADFMKKAASVLSEMADYLSKPTTELKARGIFEDAWLENSDRLRKSDTPENRIQLIKDILELRSELSFNETVEYASDLTTTKINILKERNEYVAVVNSIIDGMRATNTDEAVIQAAKQQLDISEELTPQQVLESLGEILSQMHAGDMQFAVLNCPPPDECRQCGELQWTFISLSPNKKSATYRCGYCNKKEIIIKGMVNVNERSRSPIPKDVLRDVWQRDGGKCVECGSNENLEYDHIIAVSRGGANTVRNLQLLCQPCNRKKSDREPGS